jgi:hypothetical protein
MPCRPTLFTPQVLEKLNPVLDFLWRYPLKRTAQDAIRRQMRLGITDEALLDLVLRRAEEDNLCEVTDRDPAEPVEPRLICSLGPVAPRAGPHDR